MRYVTVPEPIVLLDLRTGERMRNRVQLANGRTIETDEELPPFSLWQLIRDVALEDPRAGAGWKAGQAAHAWVRDFQHAKAGDVVQLEEEHWELLKSIVDAPHPSIAVRGSVLAQILPILKAVREASDLS